MSSATSLPRVAIVGAGSIGGLFGTRLAQGHAEVGVVARGRTLEALQGSGWVLEHGGARTAVPVRAVAEPRELGPQDVVVIAVKATALEQVAPLIEPLLGPDTVVVPAVNGVPWWFSHGLPALADSPRLRSSDSSGVLARLLPFERVLGAVVYPSCSTPAPGVCRHHSGTRLVFGEPDPAAGADTPRLSAWVALLRRAGFDASPSADIRAEVWRKLLGNACFNPVSFLTETATDVMIDDPRMYTLFDALMHETLAVGRALGIDPNIEVASRIALTRDLGHVKTSMLQDLEAGRLVEIDAILGAVVELARRVGVATPANAFTYGLARLKAATRGLLAEAAPAKEAP